MQKGEKVLLKNYRPISILPSISKIFEKVIFNQVYQYFSHNNLFYPSQYGFRSGYSTEQAVLDIVDRVIQDMDKGNSPINVYLDLSKAFDTLNHEILLDTLSHYGIKGKAISVFASYLNRRQQYVEFKNTKWRKRHIKTGVPQGSVLGPLMFIICMNDISSVSKHFHFINYADDSTLSSTLRTFGNSTIDELNTELQHVSTWLKVNKLSLNIEKTKYMIFRSHNKIIHPLNIKFDGKYRMRQ